MLTRGGEGRAQEARGRGVHRIRRIRPLVPGALPFVVVDDDLHFRVQIGQLRGGSSVDVCAG